MILKLIFRMLVITALSFPHAAAPVSAQTAPPAGAMTPQQAAAEATPTAQAQQSLPPEAGLDEVTIVRDNFAGKYNQADIVNLSKLYWRLGAFDPNDDVAVSNYVKINDCKIYTEYFNDDLEWKEILQVMKQHVASARETFPLNFQFVLQLNLGRYDPVLGGFPLVNNTGFTDAKRIEVNSVDLGHEICYDRSPIKDFPRNLIILLNDPFTLNFVKMDEHVAQAYILRKKSEYNRLDDRARIKRYEREAYLRLRVTFSQYNGNVRSGSAGQGIQAILYGTLDGYEIFEDSKQTRMLASVDLNAKRAAEAEMLGGPMSVPATPATATPPSADDRTQQPNPRTAEPAAPAAAPTPAAAQ